MRSRRQRWWRKSVETAPPGWPSTWFGRSATTWCQSDFSKLVELPDGHTPHFRDSTCKALILSIVARRSLVRRVAGLWGSEGLSGALLIAQVRKLCRNPFGLNGVFYAPVGRVRELCRNSANSDRELTLESLWCIGILACRDTHDNSSEWMIHQS
jgi:hypothetical protein